ncbi:helix-turn-helix domain-containing protein [Pectobacterium polaris]|uniref:helix-turn-helix domain-containing protein n=1 Tax=Pectobacterium polaris TaxID=2042057 RepID=UPI0023AF42AF|nr:helix-turn-helix domain-containing protein [Pectobacterium polaris]MDE8742615.1 helix-turn-helix domain-containing protein [Pectobacterium polaris]MDE8754457.1 helix-turn-helix domain-containing protein [Pectobacterium polaris]
MKSQDIGLMLKLICLQRQEHRLKTKPLQAAPGADIWWDWEISEESYDGTTDLTPTAGIDDWFIERYSVRALAVETGISKSQVSLSLREMIAVGLIKRDRKLNVPRTNVKALSEFIIYGLRYVFPAKMGELTRGIATSIGAPVLENKLMGAGDTVPVWPDAKGKTKGQSVEPLFKTVSYAVRRDPEMYALLALTDAIRIGLPRERNVASNMLMSYMDVNK